MPNPTPRPYRPRNPTAPVVITGAVGLFCALVVAGAVLLWV